MKSKVLILFCGGTLVMEPDANGVLCIPEKEKALDVLRTMEPKLDDVVDLEVIHIDNIDSTNINPEHWNRMSNEIEKRYDDFDGFVITHGTDTMAYTASALSYTMQNLGKPVILTGSQIPGSALETDARRNFVNAVRIAQSDIAGVYIVFDRKIIRGSRSTKLSESRLDAFDSVAVPVTGEIRVDVRFRDDTPRRHFRQPSFKTGFVDDIVVVLLFPGMPEKHLLTIIEDGVSGLILLGYGTGNIACAYFGVLDRAKELGIPVVISSQCKHGSTSMHLYDVGRQALDKGAIQAFDMSIEATVTKLMWVLKRCNKLDKISKLLNADLSNEISV